MGGLCPHAPTPSSGEPELAIADTKGCPAIFKGATKSYFTHYSFVVIISFNIALCSSAFSPVPFRKLVFRLFVLALNQDNKICVIMLSNFDM